MTRWRIAPWLLNFVLAKALPRFATAAAVTVITALFFRSGAKTLAPALSNAFQSAYWGNNAPHFLIAIAVAGCALLATVGARARSKGRHRRLQPLARWAKVSALGFDYVLLQALVPLAFAIAFFRSLDITGHGPLPVLYVYCAVYVVLMVLVDFIRTYDDHPPQTLAYCVRHTGPEASRELKTVGRRTSQVLSHCHWVGEVRAVLDTPKSVVVAASLLLDAESWDESERHDLAIFTRALEIEWGEANLIVERIEWPKALVKDESDS